MILIGAKSHALEVLDVVLNNNPSQTLSFFDNVSLTHDNPTINKFPILKTAIELSKFFKKDKDFILAIGNSSARKKMAAYCEGLGGNLSSVISKYSIISQIGVVLQPGLNIMHGTIIHPEVFIGRGTLLNCCTIIHHEAKIGEFCEICPGSIITGNVNIGNSVMIGAGAVILPKINIGDNAVIGAGAVITKDVKVGEKIVGNPGRVLPIK